MIEPLPVPSSEWLGPLASGTPSLSVYIEQQTSSGPPAADVKNVTCCCTVRPVLKHITGSYLTVRPVLKHITGSYLTVRPVLKHITGSYLTVRPVLKAHHWLLPNSEASLKSTSLALT